MGPEPIPSGDAARARSAAAAGGTRCAVARSGSSGSIRGRAGVGGVSTVVSPGSINAGVSSRAEASCAAAGVEGDGADLAGPGTGNGGGSGQPASRGVSTIGGVPMATGPRSAGPAGSGIASPSSDSAGIPTIAAFEFDVRRLLSTTSFVASTGRGGSAGDGGRDEPVRIGRGTGGGAAAARTCTERAGARRCAKLDGTAVAFPAGLRRLRAQPRAAANGDFGAAWCGGHLAVDGRWGFYWI